jgi:hypothetical protein
VTPRVRAGWKTRRSEVDRAHSHSG